MNVDYQMLFNIAMVVVAGSVGWILGRITKALDTLDADVRALPHNYVSKADYREDISEIKVGIQRIFDKLDGKQDRLK